MATDTPVITAPAVEKPSVVVPAAEAPVVKPANLESLTDKQYDQWRLTGEIPAEEPAKPAAKEPAEASGDGAKPGAEEGTAPPQEHKKGVGSMSHRELRELARAQEAEIERLKKGEPAKAPIIETKAEKKEKAEPRPRPDDKNSDGTPKFKDWNDYEDARDDWLRKDAMREFRETLTREQQEQTVAQQNRAIEQSWRQRVDKASEKHTDMAEALDPEKGPGKRIGKGSVVDGFILDSEHGAEILYHFHKDRADLERYATMNPFQAARELTRLESTFSGEPAKKAPPAKEPIPIKVTPKPASDVGGRGSAAVDEVNKAVVDDDVGAYIDAANRRDIAARKKG